LVLSAAWFEVGERSYSNMTCGPPNAEVEPSGARKPKLTHLFHSDNVCGSGIASTTLPITVSASSGNNLAQGILFSAGASSALCTV
jgi:hypothetical protein